jgi:hypothetical protein
LISHTNTESISSRCGDRDNGIGEVSGRLDKRGVAAPGSVTRLLDQVGARLQSWPDWMTEPQAGRYGTFLIELRSPTRAASRTEPGCSSTISAVNGTGMFSSFILSYGPCVRLRRRRRPCWKRPPRRLVLPSPGYSQERFWGMSLSSGILIALTAMSGVDGWLRGKAGTPVGDRTLGNEKACWRLA